MPALVLAKEQYSHAIFGIDHLPIENWQNRP